MEKGSARWLKDLARQSQTAGFDLNAWIPVWERENAKDKLEHPSRRLDT
jgi:hypothetical protein